MTNITPELVSRYNSSSITMSVNIYMLLPTLTRAKEHQPFSAVFLATSTLTVDITHLSVVRGGQQLCIAKYCAPSNHRIKLKGILSSFRPPQHGPLAREKPISESNKVNSDQACLCFILVMCQVDCYPLQGQIKDNLVKDVCTQANTVATCKARATTVPCLMVTSDTMLIIGCRGSALSHKIEDMHVQALLLNVTFCDLVIDAQGTPIMYSNPVFKQLVINIFYGQHSIAVTMPAGFATTFPAAALVLVCVRSTTTGVYITADLHADDTKDYVVGLATINMYMKVGTQHGKQKNYIWQAQHDIVLELQLGQHHAHILPTPLVPGVIDSDSVNDGGGKDEISEWYRVDAAQLNDTYNLRCDWQKLQWRVALVWLWRQIIVRRNDRAMPKAGEWPCNVSWTHNY
ncbi:hypothetical protein FIBSPDRAFT_891288 [Athelia psychrophila]|uniref:Uncharacterized protein n=1 Tax=Athelia psychrophila TaxID=1759441 RepID=A0A166JZG5_9AGAM|nr:hypothetical protein FIBSPDRAFT_891288 [Fibularhizoctonia sp. CBS 109695]